MNFDTIELFDKQAKKLSKKYKNLKKDLALFITNFESIDRQATLIYENLYKVRLINSNKNKGKSSGYRVYYYVKHKENIYLVTIYDKSEITMIDESMLIKIIKNELE